MASWHLRFCLSSEFPKAAEQLQRVVVLDDHGVAERCDLLGELLLIGLHRRNLTLGLTPRQIVFAEVTQASRRGVDLLG